jgi:predicted RecA/RadA family phage recombinase
MGQADFRYGDPLMIDYTPAANVALGEVVLFGNTAGVCTIVAHSAIETSKLGAAAAGGGVYDVVSLQNSTNGTKVWWDDAANKVTTTSTNNALFGFIVSGGGAGANTTVQALHEPYV